jgi:hypothetical protein
VTVGRRFSAVIGRLGMPTGDGRIISPGGLTSRDLPQPLSWQEKSAPGHEGSVVVGRIESIEFHQDMVTATGSMLETLPDTWRAIELIEAGVIGPSMDLDDFEYVVDGDERVVITSARVSGATLVPIEAFAEVSISLDPLPVPDVSRETSEPAGHDDMDWLYASADVSRETSAPPLEYFMRPAEVGPVTVEGDRVFGYVATWGTCHVGLPGCTTAPSSSTGYAHFLRKPITVATGEKIPVGVLTVGGGHADTKLGIVPATEHYDDVGAVAAKVNIGEDEHGIWVAGWVPPYADPVKVRQLSDLDVSGDWRMSGTGLELIAVCAVNTPGFPVLRKVSFSMERGGQQTLIGQFRVQPATVEASDVSRETSADDARARWLWASRKEV